MSKELTSKQFKALLSEACDASNAAVTMCKVEVSNAITDAFKHRDFAFHFSIPMSLGLTKKETFEVVNYIKALGAGVGFKYKSDEDNDVYVDLLGEKHRLAVKAERDARRAAPAV